jgi:hypothetical protein
LSSQARECDEIWGYPLLHACNEWLCIPQRSQRWLQILSRAVHHSNRPLRANRMSPQASNSVWFSDSRGQYTSLFTRIIPSNAPRVVEFHSAEAPSYFSLFTEEFSREKPRVSASFTESMCLAFFQNRLLKWLVLQCL